MEEPGSTVIGFSQFLKRVNQQLMLAALLGHHYTILAVAIDESQELERRHSMGFRQQFLMQLGRILSEAIRYQPTDVRSDVDVLGYFQDLFLFALPNTDFNCAMPPVRRIIDITRREASEALGDPSFLVPLSVGVLTWDPLSSPIAAADFVYRTIEILYQAKKDKPNRLYLHRLGLAGEAQAFLYIKHGQTATGALDRPESQVEPNQTSEEEPTPKPTTQRPQPAKKRRTKTATSKKSATKPFWKFW